MQPQSKRIHILVQRLWLRIYNNFITLPAEMLAPGVASIL